MIILMGVINQSWHKGKILILGLTDQIWKDQLRIFVLQINLFISNNTKN